jgi:hypothetical protein
MNTSKIHHYNEIAFVGGPGIGKTDLINRLMHKMQQFKIKRVKLDNDLSIKQDLVHSYFNDVSCDFIFLESHHSNFSTPKFIFLRNMNGEKEKSIINDFHNNKIDNVLAFISPDRLSLSKINSTPVFHPDQLPGIEYFILSYWKKKFKNNNINTLLLSNGPETQPSQSMASRIDLFKNTSSNVFYANNAATKIINLDSLETTRKKFINLGHFSDLLTLQLKYPSATWIIADINNDALNQKNIELILNKRNPFKIGTVLGPESLLEKQDQIWMLEPKSQQVLLQSLSLSESKQIEFIKTFNLNHILMKSNNLHIKQYEHNSFAHEQASLNL